MIVLIDNYDSFSYNLYQLIGSVEPDLKVIRNDEMSVEEVEELHPEAIVLSPGPGRPQQAGICIETVKRLGDRIPILGVCLGHQSICEAYGATVTYAKRLMHGKTSEITVDTESHMFQGFEKRVLVGRYHSLAASGEAFPDALHITAKTDDGEIMAVEHVKYPVYGLQFHPESILTPCGEALIENFLKAAKV